MVFVFFASIIVLLGLAIVVKIESMTGRRLGGTARRLIDRRLLQSVRILRLWMQQCAEYMQRDVFMKTLHALAYTALILVRYVEQRLVRLTIFFRSFRKRREATKGRFHKITREHENK